MIIGTAGHIDHGKTALVRALTGVDTDRLPEEKRRGITIELGFAPLHLADVGMVGLVDVPGHEAFVRTMLAGASGIDLALLVIAADEGVMPQTREHLAILSLLDVRHAVVALTKRDAAEEDWVALVREDVTMLLAETPFAGAPIVETSAVTGAGIEALREALREALVAVSGVRSPRHARDLFRMPIDRAFSVKGTGTVVTGTVWSGSVGAQTPLRLFPLDRPVRARGVQSHGATRETIEPGTRAAIALAAIDLADVSRGAMLVEDGAWVASRVLRADVALLEGVTRALRPREWVRLHLGTSEVGARVVSSGGPQVAGDIRGARVVLDAPIVARAGDRFVLRLPSPPTTIGGGIVVDPSPGHRRPRPWPAGLPPVDRLRRLLDESGVDGLQQAALPVRLGLPADACNEMVASHSWVLRAEGLVFSSSIVEAVAERQAASIARYHREQSLDAWVPRTVLRSDVPVPETIGSLALAQLVGTGSVEQGAGGVRRTGWTVAMSASQQRERDWLLTRLQAAGAEPPSMAELRSEREGNDPTPLLRILERERFVVQVEADRYYAADCIQYMVGRLRQEMAPDRVYGPSELRELLGTTRKYLIPFLEYCDRQRITERRSDGRVLGPGVR